MKLGIIGAMDIEVALLKEKGYALKNALAWAVPPPPQGLLPHCTSPVCQWAHQ